MALVEKLKTKIMFNARLASTRLHRAMKPTHYLVSIMLIAV